MLFVADDIAEKDGTHKGGWTVTWHRVRKDLLRMLPLAPRSSQHFAGASYEQDQGVVNFLLPFADSPDVVTDVSE